jgi:hypothetical protein
MMKLLMPVVAATVALTVAPVANATTQGEYCQTWHATTNDPNGHIMTCVHTRDTGHLMIWEYGDMSHNAMDQGYRTPSGFKTDDQSDWYGFGSGRPCNSNDVTVIKVTERGNAIERWGPKGCDPSLPMTGTN